MKLKSKLITGIVIACFLWGKATLHAQGIYSADDNTTAVTTPSSGGSGLFRADPSDPFAGNQGSGDNKGGTAPGFNSNEDPIGEGILILSLLSGAYAVVKRNIKNKNEN